MADSMNVANCNALSSLSEASGPAKSPILQIHPSLRCNLACTHCYSESSPTARTELDAVTVCEVVSDAAAMGYQVVSVSGGEPLMYGGLDSVLAHAKSLGLVTTVTTNGFFAGEQRLNRLRELVDVLVFSLDGPPEIHNAIRGSARAFEQLETGLGNACNAGIPFGLIHTLTRRNWEHLLWVAEFAHRHGARLLQIHPLELTGRAGSFMAGDSPDEDVLSKIYVLVIALSCSCQYADKMKLQLDLLFRDHLRDEPGLIYAEELETRPEQTAAPQFVGLLVLEPDGTVVPVAYGFSRHYKVCNVKEKRLADAWPNYVANGHPAFKELCRRVWDELCAPDAPLLTNWHEVIVSRSHGEKAVEPRTSHSALSAV